MKGFIDTDRNVYTISNDTKVVSKIIELLLIPRLERFAQSNGLSIELPSKQNFYPDLTFKDIEGRLFAVDFKTSYYDGDTVNGLTLGSYWGYFRRRDETRNMDYAYGSYSSHLVLGILYKHTDVVSDERRTYSVDQLVTIRSVIKSFLFFVQPKWKIASDMPGSGNTRNIGAVKDIDCLLHGSGPFAELGEDVFDDYWMNYRNKADANGSPRYNNLATYKKHLQRQALKLAKFK